MRARHWLMTVSLGLSLAGVAGQGCGGSSSSPAADAGADVGADVHAGDVDAPDTTPVSTPDASTLDTSIVDSGPACAIEASIETLSVPDASLPEDASVGTCLACAAANCMPDEAACDMDCACKMALVGIVTCLGNHEALKTCAASALGEQNAFNLAICILGSCEAACGVTGFSLTDSGRDAAEDAPATDGPSEATDAPAGDAPLGDAPVSDAPTETGD